MGQKLEEGEGCRLTDSGGGTLALEVSELGKRFGEVDAVGEVTFNIARGETVGLLGPNGSGKTTTLHMILGMIEPTQGTIRINGEPPDDVATRRQVGVAPDDLPLPGALTGHEFLEFHARLRGYEDAEVRTELADLFDMERHLDRSIIEYSQGMKRKLQFIAAVCHRPSFLMLDEPHRGLDPEASQIMSSLMSILAENGTGTLIATHDLNWAEREMDRVVILHEGTQLAFDRPAGIIAEANSATLEEAFLRMTGLAEKLETASRRMTRAFDH